MNLSVFINHRTLRNSAGGVFCFLNLNYIHLRFTYIFSNKMKTKIILIFLLLFVQKNICYGQDEFHNYTKYEVTNVPKTNIQVNLPLDKAIAFFEESVEKKIKKIGNNKYRLFNDYQAFVTK